MSAPPITGRLKLPAIAYLRALAEGLPMAVAGERYLGVAGGAVELRHAHRAVVGEVRTLARRRGDPAWRLIGVELERAGKPPSGGRQQAGAVPSLEEWAASEGIEGFSTDDLLEIYQRRFGIADDDAQTQRRRARNERLRVRRLELLRQLEKAAREIAKPSDRLAGWIDPAIAARLEAADIETIGQLQSRATSGERWWRDIPAIGDTKARAIAAQIEQLLASRPDSSRSAGIAASARVVATVSLDWKRAIGATARPADSLNDVVGGGRSVTAKDASLAARSAAPANFALSQTSVVAAIDAADDRAAIASWVAARQGSPLTVRQYTREGERFLLWTRIERGRGLCELTVDDCRAYMTFLQDVPAAWISTRKVEPYAPGWAPFGRQPSVGTRKYAIGLLHAMCGWLVDARYLAFNPWALVNRRLGDEARPRGRQSRAFTPQAWAALMTELERPAPRASSPQAVERLRWLCVVGESTGLRSAELIRATKADVEMTRVGALLHVLGKGLKHRQVPLPKVALAATERYFRSRGLDWSTAAPNTPLLAALDDPLRPLGYAALYETFTRFVKRALKRSELSADERQAALRASLHWLRHTHGTRFAERGGAPDVLQANFGHADPRTTAGYYPAQLERRQRQLETAFSG